MAVFNWTENTPVTANNLNAMQQFNQDLVDTKITNNFGKFGKKLWEGSFSSGTITVDDLMAYSFIIVMLDSVPCFGTLSRGAGGIGAYQSYAVSHYGYRFNVSGNTLTIDNNDRGGTNGTTNVPVTEIYGIF